MKRISRPLIVELAGLPNSGKTTTAEIVGHYFGRSNYEVLIVGDPAISCPISRKLKLEFAAFILNRLINLVLEQKHYGKAHDILLMDIGIFDTNAFIRLMCEELKISDRRKQTLISYAGSPVWGKLVDVLFFLDIPPKLALERDQLNQLTTKQGAIANRSTLRTLSSCYHEVLGYYEKLNGKDRVQIIDASRLDPLQIAQVCKDKIEMLLSYTK
jgi:thymidylate kinase